MRRAIWRRQAHDQVAGLPTVAPVTDPETVLPCSWLRYRPMWPWSCHQYLLPRDLSVVISTYAPETDLLSNLWILMWSGSCPSHPGEGPLLLTQEPTRSHAWLGSSCSYWRYRNGPVTCHQLSQPQAWNTPAWTGTLQETCCPQPWRQACWPWSGCRS